MVIQIGTFQRTKTGSRSVTENHKHIQGRDLKRKFSFKTELTDKAPGEHRRIYET